ncbi:MAG: TfoX/Sxy family protein [Candidatus Accumulibacter sp.]|jgi:TfoX/Sxy family transcriptional regulator of competence genes|nr:TfoX/Sxy family protein [Accumulibacter sp.]
MGTSIEYAEYVCDQIRGTNDIRHKKMFGEYMVYVDDKPILLVCDDTVFVKIVPALDALMADAGKGYPYDGAKEHYVLDIDNAELARDAVAALLPVTAVPKPRKRKGGKDDAV